MKRRPGSVTVPSMDRRIIPNDILLGEVATVLREGREAVITPSGNSMLPFIRGGKDRVVLRRMDGAAVGDIVLMHADGRYVLHRVIARDGDALTLMGDGNLRGTETCTTGDVVGTVTEILRPDGRRRVPGKGRFWRLLWPVRRYLLAIYKRLI
ncbi:MAG: S24/S26 family peptidase [Bacteroidales bacterium]|nr:S24/S26 family peptidase [Bacteroidales bacterium]